MGPSATCPTPASAARLGLGRLAMAFYPRDELNGDGSNWWGPNRECMFELLASQGFAAVYHQPHPTVRERGIYHAFRAQEDARALIGVGFCELGLHRIYAKTSNVNPASWRVMERLGMRREARLREAEFRDGAWIDGLIYAILADEWQG